MKVLMAVSKDDIASRFDLTVEVVIIKADEGVVFPEPRELLLSEPSGDELCALAVNEAVDLVVCGGIDEVHYEYLMWKKITLIDGVVGPYREALKLLADGLLAPNTIVPAVAQ